MEPFDGTSSEELLDRKAGELLVGARDREGLAQALAGLSALAEELAGTGSGGAAERDRHSRITGR